MINSLNLIQYVKFENSVIPPMETHHFFEKIDIFLVTSRHEGGPITSLQAAAAGRIVLGYEVGAMKDRFSQISNTFHQNFEELCIAALSLTNSSISEKIKFGKLYRQLYKEQLNNKIKVDDLLKLLYVEE
jgi:glycosyltransferase involved in cell wall biosynthesis